MEVQITKVKVKHGATSYFAGPFAGADEITAAVTVKGAKNKSEVVTAKFTSMGGIFGTNKTDARIAALTKEFSEKLVELLAK